MKVPHLLLILLFAAAPLGAGELAPGWQALTNYRAEEALKFFDRSVASADQKVAREARFGRGVALLDIQPVTDAHLAEARRIFTELADTGADDPAQ